MSLIEKFSNKVSKTISIELKLDKEREEVIAYGTFALIQMFLSIMLVIIFGYLFNVLVESLIVSFAIGILRKYSGGVHASSPINCIIIGTLISVGQALIFTYSIFLLNKIIILTLGIIVYLWAYYIVYKFAPVDCPTKPINSYEKKKQMKNGSYIILSIYLLINIFLGYLFYISSNSILLTYSLCLYGGIAWQIFTLTKTGHLFIRQIDLLF